MLEIIEGYDCLDDVRELFAEYTAMLVSIDPSFQLYLDIQHYGEEERNPSRKYMKPEGKLYLSLLDGKIAGCIALRKLDDEKCEMKRLYVRPEYRGHGIATVLVEKILEDAVEIGYSWIYLDTLPELQSAVELYEKLGFERTECYNDSPSSNTLFYRRKISGNSSSIDNSEL